MYDNVGEKIKTLAKVLGWLTLIAGVLLFFFLISDGQEEDGWYYTEFVFNTANDAFAWVSLITGALGFCSSWFIYGFGVLVEKAESIEKHLKEKGNN